MGRRWTEGELEELENDYGILSMKELEEKYKRSYPSIKEKCKTLNIRNKRTKKWTKELEESFSKDWEDRSIDIEYMGNKYNTTYEGLRSKAQELKLNRRNIDINEQEVIDHYMNGMSSNGISEFYNCSSSYIKTVLKNNNIEMRDPSHSKQIYNINENVFDKIDTQEKAYYLGFMFADGSNYTDRNCIALTVHEQDKEILDEFKRILNSEERPLYRFHNDKTGGCYFSLSIVNQKLSERLNELGVFKKKTFKLKYPNYLHDDLQNHFIRGYFDGDGCAGIYRSGSVEISILGTKELLKGIKEIFLKNCNHLRNIRIEKAKKNCDIFTLRVSGGIQVESVLDFIYENSTIKLSRKYDKYLKIKNRDKNRWEKRKKLHGSNGRYKPTIPEVVLKYLLELGNGEYKKKEIRDKFGKSKENFREILNKIYDLVSEKDLKSNFSFTNRKIIIKNVNKE